jgi:hypothetical protein
MKTIAWMENANTARNECGFKGQIKPSYERDKKNAGGNLE